jgi:hypothetical protein
MVGHYIFIFIGEIVLAMSATALKKPKILNLFSLVLQLPTHTGLICVKTLEPNISSLGPINISIVPKN